MRRITILSKTQLQKYFFVPFMKVYVRETTKILCIFEFTIVSGHKIFPSYRLSTSVQMRTT